MELKALVLGLLFSTGVFALKSGAGLYYAATCQKKISGGILLVLAFMAGYIGLFRLSFLILERFDLVRHLDLVTGLLKAGMLIHLIIAAVMAFWGVMLLKGAGGRHSLGWLTLSIPCPVCMIVIFSTSAFLMSIFPKTSNMAFWLASGSFVSVVLFTLLVMRLTRNGFGAPPESILGWVMLMISGYFILSAIIIPQVSDIERIYRLSMQSARNTGAVHSSRGVITVLLLFLSTVIPGFLWTAFKIRRAKAWT